MQISEKGLVELAGHEGICLSKYKDSVGVWTIGVGATRSEIPDIASWPLDKTITLPEALDLFKRSIKKYENAINVNLLRRIPQTSFDALVSWCYNVGTGWVRKSTVMKRINAGEYGQPLYDALMQYNRPTEIIGRRRKEAILLRDGRYSNNGKVLLFPVSTKGYPIYKAGKIIDLNIEGTVVPPPFTPEQAEEANINLIGKAILWTLEKVRSFYGNK